MRRIADESAFRDLVVQHAADLPPQQRAIADYLVEHLQLAPFLSVPELARRVGASEATVVRFAQRLGFSGFSELKMELVELLQSRLGTSGDGVPAAEPGEDVLTAVATLELDNIHRSVEAIDRAAFAAAAEAVFHANHTFAFGMGVSGHLAELACYTLVQIGVRATPLSPRFSSPREQLVALRPGDLLLVFSFPPYSRPTLDLLEEARARDVTTVAVCDRLTAPAALLGNHVLPVRSENMMFTNAIAAVTVLFNALATQIATSHRGEAVEAMSMINRVLNDDPGVLPPGR